MTLGQFQIATAESGAVVPDRSQNHAGPRLYSPLTLLAFAMLANLPAGVALLGINLRRRNQRALGNAAIALASVGALSLVAAIVVGNHLPDLRLFGFFGGLLLFALEKRQFQEALRTGASRAKWWPPWLVVIGIFAALALVALSRR